MADAAAGATRVPWLVDALGVAAGAATTLPLSPPARLSRSAAARLIKGHLVKLNGHPAAPADPVAAGDVVDLEIPETFVLEATAEQIPLEIVYEDADLVVIDKPPGMVVHPAPGHYTGTLVHALLGRGGQWSAIGGAARPGMVHRLDKGTSGLLAVARTPAATCGSGVLGSDRIAMR